TEGLGQVYYQRRRVGGDATMEALRTKAASPALCSTCSSRHDQPERPPAGRSLTEEQPVTSSPTILRRPDRLYDGYVFDLDGTVYLGDTLLPGAGEVIASVQARGC